MSASPPSQAERPDGDAPDGVAPADGSPVDSGVARPVGPTSRARRLTGLRRSRSDRVLAGVAGGLAARWQLDPVLLRVAFVVLATAGGAGVAVYLFVWAVSTDPPDGDDAEPPADLRVAPALGVGMVTLGALVLLRDAGLWFGDSVTWPLALVAAGSVVLMRGHREALPSQAGLARLLRGHTEPVGRVGLARAAAGAGLVLAGVGVFLATSPAGLTAVGPMLLAMVVTAAGLGLLLGPRLWTLSRSVAAERRERIRDAERAELAAHLHDSVLQTLALIQRTDDGHEAARLARAQERDLRDWLYGAGGTPGRLRAAVDDVAARVEARHGVRVDAVVVGDADVDAALATMVAAVGEALGNAARHAGVRTVSLFVEVGADGVEASVVDEGCGFDPAAVPADRRGLAESVVGRMRRVGGEATVTSEPGDGTEVVLRLPGSAIGR